MRIEVNFATGENVSTKSTPSFCVYPLATNRALYFSTPPEALSFLLNIHLDPMAWQFWG